MGRDEDVGDLVEDISQPYGAGEWRSGGASGMGSRAGGASTGVSALAAASIGFGLGAGLMYLLDPNSGRNRRSVLAEKTSSAGDALQRTSRDLKHRTQDLIAETRSRFGSERPGQTQTSNQPGAAQERLIPRAE
jgi:hypothetical protein